MSAYCCTAPEQFFASRGDGLDPRCPAPLRGVLARVSFALQGRPGGGRRSVCVCEYPFTAHPFSAYSYIADGGFSPLLTLLSQSSAVFILIGRVHARLSQRGRACRSYVLLRAREYIVCSNKRAFCLCLTRTTVREVGFEGYSRGQVYDFLPDFRGR